MSRSVGDSRPAVTTASHTICFSATKHSSRLWFRLRRGAEGCGGLVLPRHCTSIVTSCNHGVMLAGQALRAVLAELSNILYYY